MLVFARLFACGRGCANGSSIEISGVVVWVNFLRTWPILVGYNQNRGPSPCELWTLIGILPLEVWWQSSIPLRSLRMHEIWTVIGADRTHSSLLIRRQTLDLLNSKFQMNDTFEAELQSQKLLHGHKAVPLPQRTCP